MCHPERNLALELQIEKEINLKRYEEELNREYIIDKRLQDAKMRLELDRIDYMENDIREYREIERQLRDLENAISYLEKKKSLRRRGIEQLSKGRSF